MSRHNKSAFKLRVERRSQKLLTKPDDSFDGLVKQLGDELVIYSRSREKVINLTVVIFKTNLWNRTHTSFVDFLMDKFSIQKSYAYILIKSAKIEVEKEEKSAVVGPPDAPVKDNKNNGHPTPPKSEEKQEPEPRSNTDGNFPLSGNRNSVKSGSEQESKTEDVPLDDVDTPIPEDAIPYWNQLKEVQAVITALGKLKSIVVNGQNDKKTNWPKCANYIADTFDQLRIEISEAKPYTVCTTCMGVPSLQPGKWCGFCKGTGLISKRMWDTCSMQEIKDIRLKSNADLKKQNGPH